MTFRWPTRPARITAPRPVSLHPRDPEVDIPSHRPSRPQMARAAELMRLHWADVERGSGWGHSCGLCDVWAALHG